MSRFVIRRVRTGPPDLDAQLPITGCTVDTGSPDGDSPDDDAYHATLDRPLRYGTPAAGFLEVRRVVLHPHNPQEQPYAGMRAFPFRLSLIVDGAAAIENIAVIEIDDQDDAQTAPDAEGRLPVSSVPAALAEEFTARLDHTLSQLARLAGGHTRAEMVEPRRADTTEHVAAQTIPIYSLTPGHLRYHTHDPLEGWVERETTDPDELLYWVVNDIASEVAWRWARQTPAFSTMSERRAQRTLWLPYWHILMHGLRPEWGSRVREIIRALAPDPD